MPDYREHLFLCAQALYAFPVGVHVRPGEYLGFARTVNHEIKEMLNQKSIRYHWHEADVTVLEGFLARGDRRTSRVILEAYRRGALFDSWTGILGIMKSGCRLLTPRESIWISIPCGSAGRMKSSPGILLTAALRNSSCKKSGKKP